jgi:hypothetical protein
MRKRRLKTKKTFTTILQIRLMLLPQLLGLRRRCLPRQLQRLEQEQADVEGAVAAAAAAAVVVVVVAIMMELISSSRSNQLMRNSSSSSSSRGRRNLKLRSCSKQKLSLQALWAPKTFLPLSGAVCYAYALICPTMCDVFSCSAAILECSSVLHKFICSCVHAFIVRRSAITCTLIILAACCLCRYMCRRHCVTCVV